MPSKKIVRRKWQGLNLFCSSDWGSEFISGALEAQQVATQTEYGFLNSLCNLLNRGKCSTLLEE